jgi:hypothetical protein
MHIAKKNKYVSNNTGIVNSLWKKSVRYKELVNHMTH